jgi:hypothetical protein
VPGRKFWPCGVSARPSVGAFAIRRRYGRPTGSRVLELKGRPSWESHQGRLCRRGAAARSRPYPPGDRIKLLASRRQCCDRARRGIELQVDAPLLSITFPLASRNYDGPWAGAPTTLNRCRFGKLYSKDSHLPNSQCSGGFNSSEVKWGDTIEAMMTNVPEIISRKCGVSCITFL